MDTQQLIKALDATDMDPALLGEIRRRLERLAAPSTIELPPPPDRRRLVNLLQQDHVTSMEAARIIAAAGSALRLAGATFGQVTEQARDDAERLVVQAGEITEVIHAANVKIREATEATWSETVEAGNKLRTAKAQLDDAASALDLPHTYKVERLGRLLDLVERMRDLDAETWQRVLDLAAAMQGSGE